MRQEITSNLFTIKNKIYEITKFLYDNPENSFKETTASSYLSNILAKNNFRITQNYMNVPTSFYAQQGEGHPKVCFICEYDGDSKMGHIHGNNLSSSISIAAAISLSKVIPKIGGSVIIIGTPAEAINGSKTLLHKQGAFEDMDVILLSKPHIFNLANPKSLAKLSLKIKFNNTNSAFTNSDAYIIMINLVNQLSKNFTSNSKIQKFSFSDIDCTISITSELMTAASEIRSKLEIIATALNQLLGLTHEIILSEVPCDEMITSPTLNRIFAHNLKECGIINLKYDTNITCISSLGCISSSIPCVHSYVSIIEDIVSDKTIGCDKTIKYPSKEFAKSTLSDYAQEIAFKTAQALAFTGLDLIEKQSLILEAKTELKS